MTPRPSRRCRYSACRTPFVPTSRALVYCSTACGEAGHGVARSDSVARRRIVLETRARAVAEAANRARYRRVA